MPNPAAPPPQPSPNTGTRMMSGRKPMAVMAWASRLGVAMPVEETVTTISTCAAFKPALSSALVPASMNSFTAPSRKASVRSGQPRGCVNHSMGRTEWRLWMPVVSNTRDIRS